MWRRTFCPALGGKAFPALKGFFLPRPSLLLDCTASPMSCCRPAWASSWLAVFFQELQAEICLLSRRTHPLFWSGAETPEPPIAAHTRTAAQDVPHLPSEHTRARDSWDATVWVAVISLDSDQRMVDLDDKWPLWLWHAANVFDFSSFASGGASKTAFLCELRSNEKNTNSVMSVRNERVIVLLRLLFSPSAGWCLMSQAFVASLTSWRRACMEARRTGGHCSPKWPQWCLLFW